jgi:hypothetical protein
LRHHLAAAGGAISTSDQGKQEKMELSIKGCMHSGTGRISFSVGVVVFSNDAAGKIAYAGVHNIDIEGNKSNSVNCTLPDSVRHGCSAVVIIRSRRKSGSLYDMMNDLIPAIVLSANSETSLSTISEVVANVVIRVAAVGSCHAVDVPANLKIIYNQQDHIDFDSVFFDFEVQIFDTKDQGVTDEIQF